MTAQSGEHIVGMNDGVYRVGGVLRCGPDKRWSADLIKNLKGTPAEPRPGSGSDTIPTYAKQQGDQKQDEKYQKAPEAMAQQVRPAYIYKNDVLNHGPSPNCKACQIASGNSNSTGYSHTPECRMRFEEIFRTISKIKNRYPLPFRP